MYAPIRHQTSAMLAVVLLLFSRHSAAEEWINPGDETFRIGLGFFLPAFNSSLRVNNSTINVGDEIDLENDLGLDKRETVFWGSGMWRFAANHRISLSYYKFERGSVATALRDLTIGEETFPAGASLSTNFQFQSVPITYQYSFIKTAQHELAGTFGIHWNTIDLDVRGDAFVGGGGSVDGQVNAKAEAPLPLFGMSYFYHSNKQWTSGIHGEVFALDLDDDDVSFSGALFNVRASTEYWYYNYFGVGFAINWFSMDVDVEDSEWQGAIDYEYIGPQIYVIARF
jgi:hypothetical protein